MGIQGGTSIVLGGSGLHNARPPYDGWLWRARALVSYGIAEFTKERRDSGADHVTRSWDTIHNEDCLTGMKSMDAESVHLAFADPPFNIGYDYDVYRDKLASERYLDWCREWTAEVVRLLRPDGTFWLAIGDEYAAELKVMMQREHGLTCRSWVVWYYTFGVNCKQKFSRSHAHLFHFVKDPDEFTFNTKAIRVPSARQLVYGDSRANPAGRLPDDTWILRPQDLPVGFEPSTLR